MTVFKNSVICSESAQNGVDNDCILLRSDVGWAADTNACFNRASGKTMYFCFLYTTRHLLFVCKNVCRKLHSRENYKLLFIMNHSRQFPLNVQLPYVQERKLGSLSR